MRKAPFLSLIPGILQLLYLLAELGKPKPGILGFVVPLLLLMVIFAILLIVASLIAFKRKKLGGVLIIIFAIPNLAPFPPLGIIAIIGGILTLRSKSSSVQG
jgi:hypothetical protein